MKKNERTFAKIGNAEQLCMAQRDADCLIDYHRRLGIDYFKLDFAEARGWKVASGETGKQGKLR